MQRPPLTGEFPKFIVIEGTDGSGKTTLSKRLHESIPNSTRTAEMSDGVVGRLIRDMFTKKTQPLDRHAMAALFTADRLDHLAVTVRPALAAGNIVICDRYYYSTFAYQRFYEDRSGWFQALCSQPLLKPDVTLVINASPEAALARRRHRGSAEQLFEDQETQRELWAVYSCLDTYFPNDWIVHIDGNQPEEDVYKDAMAAIVRIPPMDHPCRTQSQAERENDL